MTLRKCLLLNVAVAAATVGVNAIVLRKVLAYRAASAPGPPVPQEAAEASEVASPLPIRRPPRDVVWMI